MTSSLENENGLLIEGRLPRPNDKVISQILNHLSGNLLENELELILKFNGCYLKYIFPLSINGMSDAVSLKYFFKWTDNPEDKGGIIFNLKMRTKDLLGMLPIARDDGGSVLALNVSNSQYRRGSVIIKIQEIQVGTPPTYINDSITFKAANSFNEYLGSLYYDAEDTKRLIEFLNSRQKPTNHLVEELNLFAGTKWKPAL